MPNETREFQAQLLGWKQIHELPDGWTSGQLLSLLESLEVDDVSENDAMEMATLALQDLETDEASDRVLEAVFGETMRRGVRQNLAHDLTEDRPWEDFAELSQQKGIFNALVLLQRAFPRDYDRPDAVSIVLRLETGSERGNTWLDASPPDPAFLLRILAGGMNDSAMLKRLFGESLRGRSFPEAGALLWQVSRSADAAPGREFTLISSHQWFDPLKDVESWTATAWEDAPVVEER
ncbi:MAG: hypothetical protein DHS20C21_11220 [Gemmatimonadota bacterium]|nr:MAG: hypothetical protein DHS20C21_11220 [Gemmatimonadota bacterium]